MSSLAHRVEGETVQGGGILVIDDEQRILSFVRRGLQAEGMVVDLARNGEAGLRLAHPRSFGLVILHLVMSLRPSARAGASFEITLPTADLAVARTGLGDGDLGAVLNGDAGVADGAHHRLAA